MWDPRKAAFRIITFVIVCEVLLVTASYCLCVWAGLENLKLSEACEDGRLSRILADALAVGLALYSSSSKQPPE